MTPVRDYHGRPLGDLRVSVTDRCNFRCPYCLPREMFGEAHHFVPRQEILTFEEIARVALVMRGLGMRKIRLTGGEPLLRQELPELVRQLSAIEGLEDLAMTTNGSLLASQAQPLKEAGLHRVTVSLDALDGDLFRRLSGSHHSVDEVLSGIRAARQAGLPVKLNCVLQRGVNESQILPLVEWSRGEGVTLRFIEFMDVGNHNHWDASLVVPAAEVRAIVASAHPFVPVENALCGEVARRYRYIDGAGEVGFIASITEPFCRDCNRVRLTADGKVVTCLFASGGTDIRALLRSGAGDAELSDFIANLWGCRDDRYSELRAAAAPRRKVEMSYVGG